MDAYCSMLTTSNIKANAMALETLPQLITIVRDGLRDAVSRLVPDLLRQASSKQNSELALNVLNLLIDSTGEFMSSQWM